MRIILIITLVALATAMPMNIKRMRSFILRKKADTANTDTSKQHHMETKPEQPKRKRSLSSLLSRISSIKSKQSNSGTSTPNTCATDDDGAGNIHTPATQLSSVDEYVPSDEQTLQQENLAEPMLTPEQEDQEGEVKAETGQDMTTQSYATDENNLDNRVDKCINPIDLRRPQQSPVRTIPQDKTTNEVELGGRERAMQPDNQSRRIRNMHNEQKPLSDPRQQDVLYARSGLPQSGANMQQQMSSRQYHTRSPNYYNFNQKPSGNGSRRIARTSPFNRGHSIMDRSGRVSSANLSPSHYARTESPMLTSGATSAWKSDHRRGPIRPQRGQGAQELSPKERPEQPSDKDIRDELLEIDKNGGCDNFCVTPNTFRTPFSPCSLIRNNKDS